MSDSYLAIARFRGGSCGTHWGLDLVSRWRGLCPQHMARFDDNATVRNNARLYGDNQERALGERAGTG